MPCKHKNFSATVEVGRLQMSDRDATIIGYSVAIAIECSDCKLPFEFIGVPCGLLPDRPTASVDFLELRVPVIPKGEQLPPAVRHGFVINPVKVSEAI